MTGKQIEAAKKLLPEFSKRNSEQIMIDTELSCREMINSCLAYKQDNDFYNISKKIFGDAAERYLRRKSYAILDRAIGRLLESYNNLGCIY